MHLRRLLLLTGSIAVLALAACGDEGSETTDAAATAADTTSERDANSSNDADLAAEVDAVDACALVTPEDLEAVLGETVPEGEDTGLAGQADCVYDVGLVRYAISDPANVEAQRSQLAQPKPVESVGEDAVVGTSGSGPEISVVFGDDQFLVITLTDPKVTTDQLVQLAETAIGRI